MTIKEMLESGKTTDELMKDFRDQINSAKKEIEQEKRKDNAALDTARENLVRSLIYYIKKLDLGLEDDFTSEEVIKKTIEALKDAEDEIAKEMKTFTRFISCFSPRKEDKKEHKEFKPKASRLSPGFNIDEVMDNFLKTL